MIFVLYAIRDALILCWNWIARNLKKCKFFGFFSLTWVSIRAAVGLYGSIMTRVQAVKQLAIQTGSAMSASGSPQSGLLDKINAVLPVSETLAFMAAYGAVVLLTTSYMFIRSLYNAVPVKAT